MTIIKIGNSFVHMEEVFCVIPVKDRVDVWEVHFRNGKTIALEGSIKDAVVPEPKAPPVSRGPQKPKG